MINIAICDARKESSDYYKNLCLVVGKKMGFEVKVQVYNNGEALLFAVAERQKEKIDIVFIDINESGANGKETVHNLRKNHFDKEIIFLTKSKEEFREAFDVSAFNYIVKEEDAPARFQDVFTRAVKKIEEADKEYIILSCAGENRCLPVRSIYYFEIVNRIVTVYSEEGTFEFISTMNKLDENLTDFGFVRIHRAFLVAISRIEFYSMKEVTLIGGAVLPIGRAYYKQIKEKIQGKSNG
ncbi:MAG: LytTR family DNA-binding domain-containing protein [Longicatena sp.]